MSSEVNVGRFPPGTVLRLSGADARIATRDVVNQNDQEGEPWFIARGSATVSGTSFVSTSRLAWIIDKDKTGHPINNE